ncbi:hypothetical protein [Bradyrhizobium sp. AUGA SZCCT0431]|uniref:hypothetical protein n=1 Tax=Bradyrhizobium sp. AUGA SZCCT0431 TaxID=2807674 RepID=UPI001BAAB592|nr:hypothetical protein [Bradyrhizobium sp. AUGA SZCCT0431]MBR1144899.1 hypothetical protein [Bradyrhizobium sp. AUGA SZCCT0431]
MDTIIVTAAAIAEMDLIVEPPQAHYAVWPEHAAYHSHHVARSSPPHAWPAPTVWSNHQPHSGGKEP